MERYALVENIGRRTTVRRPIVLYVDHICFACSERYQQPDDMKSTRTWRSRCWRQCHSRFVAHM